MPQEASCAQSKPTSDRPWSEKTGRVYINTSDYLDFFGKYSAGGRQRYVRDIALLVQQLGREPIIVQKAHQPFDKTCENGIRVLGVAVPLGISGDALLARHSLRLCRAEDDILYASAEDAWPFYMRGAKAIQHGIWWDGPRPRFARVVSRTRSFGMLERCKSVLCVDTNFINWVRSTSARGSDLALKCSYVPNFADVDRIPITKQPVGKIGIITARRHYFPRGLDLYVAALGIAASRGLDFFATVCTTSNQEEILRLARAAGIADRLSVSTESMESILSKYAEHHISVVPTRWSEGTSLSCVEGLAAGLPTVATDVGGLGNLVVPGFNGELVSPTPEALAEAVLRVASPSTWRSMHKNALSMRAALDKKNWDRRVLEWLAN